jgi:hypothetical protein
VSNELGKDMEVKDRGLISRYLPEGAKENNGKEFMIDGLSTEIRNKAPSEM